MSESINTAQGLKTQLKLARKKIRHLTSLLEATNTLSSTLDLNRLLELIMDFATKDLNAERSTLFLLDRKRNELWSRIAQDLEIREIRLPVGTGFAGWVAKTGSIINIKNAYEDPRFNREIDKKSGFRTQNVLCAPIWNSSKELIGVMQVLNKKHGSFTKEDEEFLIALSKQVSLSLQNAILHRDALEKKKMEEEIKLAKEIQASLLPQKVDLADNLEISTTCIPCEAVGGDSYDVIPIDRTHVGISIADVSGKGIPAALLMVNIQSAMRVIAPQHDSPSMAVESLNKSLCGNVPAGLFVTLLYCILDISKGYIYLCNAGHPPAIFVSHNGKARPLYRGGVILGVMGDAKYEHEKIPYKPGDTLVMFTDGIIEAMKKNGDAFGLERLTKVIEKTSSLCPDDMRQAILQEVSRFIGNKMSFQDSPPQDDLTLVILKYKNTASTDFAAEKLTIPSSIKEMRKVDLKTERFARKHGLNRLETHRLCLAVHEAVLNAIIHGNRGNPKCDVKIIFESHPASLRVSIKDHGEGFDAPSRRHPKRSPRTREWGLDLMKSSMDSVDLRKHHDGFEVILTKNIRRRSHGKNRR